MIGSFNVKTFGLSKLRNQLAMGYIEQIIRRYDVVFIMEIRDSSGTLIPSVLNILNTKDEGWNVTYSERLGLDSSSYREQYAYYYRTDHLTLLDSYQYDDGVDDGTDAFSREPFGVLFQSSHIEALKEFGLVGVHIDPDKVAEEMDALPEVIQDAEGHWDTKNIMLMGDLNADCSYISKQKLSDLRLRTDSSYLWLIGDEVDTTVSSTDCAYDR
ncbi:DNASE1 [Bugula neritina]|uniref:DNASE1 n=1 Tax=Bugula neritina TaxID=10212 RepID=A0A7J7J4U7_BUGNE|nr:DNASE1 [Bugula neritina]